MAEGRPPGKDASDDDFRQLVARLEAWSIPPDAVDRVHDAARASLSEVKALTEYQDGKASRLLTVVAFLSALVAAVFTRFAGDFGWPVGPVRASAEYLLPAATYAAFLAYVMIVTIAVLIVIHAIRPTLNVPETWKGAGRPGRPRSMLFFGKILDVKAPTWGQAFEEMAGKDGHELKEFYAKNYITDLSGSREGRDEASPAQARDRGARRRARDPAVVPRPVRRDHPRRGADQGVGSPGGTPAADRRDAGSLL